MSVVPLKKTSALAEIPRIPEKYERYARIMLRAIERELGKSPHFTREDLLQLSVFQHVSTITRYHDICVAVHALLDQGAVVSMSRTDLVLASRQGGYRNGSPLSDQYGVTIRRLVRKQKPGSSVSVMDLVHDWKTDPHLTVNLKRVAVRGAVTALIRENLLVKSDDFEYKVGGV